jgi:tetratricopeptide (TPR) repeat protein
MSLFDMSVGILQALNNLGSIYVDCGKLDQAADCYMNALNIKHTRAHQGLARVYHLKNQRKAAFDEMTKLIEKAHSSASAYEKRSEYCDREKAKDDLNMATQLDPLRTYPYRYRAAGNHHHSVLEIPFWKFCLLSMQLLKSSHGYSNVIPLTSSLFPLLEHNYYL